MPTYAIRMDPTTGFPGEPCSWIAFTITRHGFRHVFREDNRRTITNLTKDLRKLTPSTIAMLCGDE
jgi:hypothetical protein